NAGAGLSAVRVSHSAKPIVLVSHRLATLRSTSSQPRPRRHRMQRAPMSASRSKGTGGIARAVRMGFHDWMPRTSRKPFTKRPPAESNGGDFAAAGFAHERFWRPARQCLCIDERNAMNTTTKLEHITLGGGCFWCLEAVYEQVDGVAAVESGYSNGH